MGARTEPEDGARAGRARAGMSGGVARSVRRGREALVRGDRPFIVAFVALLAVAALMLAAPLSRHLESRERIALLEQQRDALHAEIERLEGRAEDLEDPAQIELLAREQLGLVRPGEVPYVVVVPEPERPRVVPGADEPAGSRPWYRRLLGALSELLG